MGETPSFSVVLDCRLPRTDSNIVLDWHRKSYIQASVLYARMLSDWKSHGSEYYECSRYKENPNIANESVHVQAREALKKYLFYYERVSKDLSGGLFCVKACLYLTT